MNSRRCSFVIRVPALLLLCFVFSIPAFSQGADFDSAIAPPAREIDLSAWGFHGLTSLERFVFRANLTVYFLDNSHLLLTFNAQRKLMHRLPECPPTHQDHMVHAVIVDLTSANLLKETDWYVHDYRPYLWPLSPGHFLLRKLNSLYDLDSDLHETLLKSFSDDLLWVSLTPDGKQIVAETALAGPSGTKSEATEPKQLTDASRRARVKIDFLNSSTLAVEHSMNATGVVELNATTSGYADFTRNVQGNIWLVRFGPSPAQRQSVTRIKSPCKPDLLFPLNNAVLIGRCSSKNSDYNVSAFSLAGHPLWRQRWPQRNYFPALARSQDGSRFAVGTITPSREQSPPLATDEDDQGWPDVEQDIRVFETASGRQILAARVKSVALKNPNFALAPDGNHFALLDGSILKIYDLPTVSTEERANYIALAADSPGLAPPTGNSSDIIGDAAAKVDDIDPEDATPGGESDLRAALRATATSPDAISGLPLGNSNPANAPASSTDQEPSPVTTFTTAAREIVVDVTVTDSRGHPVKELPATDFHIAEDRRPQKIKYFHEFKGSAGIATAPVAAVKLPPNVFSNNSTPLGEKPLVAVVLDVVNTPTQDLPYAKDQLLKFLRKKPADTQFSLFVLSDAIQMLHGFTSDENVLAATVKGRSAIAGRKNKSGWRSYSDLKSTLDMSPLIRAYQDSAASDPHFQSTVNRLVHLQAENRVNDLDWRVRATVDGFSQLARYLAGLPGRKNVVWMSGSFPSHFFPELQLNRDTANQSSDLVRNYSADLRRMTNLLAEAHAAVYPVDVRGLQGESVFRADAVVNPTPPPDPGSQKPAAAASMTTGGTNTTDNIQPLSPLQEQAQQDRESKAGEQAMMDAIAEGTGGKAFYNTNGIQQAIETAVEQGSTYYTISFTSDNRSFDGKFRKLHLSLAQKGYRLAYRRGYYADPLQLIKNSKELDREIGVHAMQRGAPEARQLVFAVRAVPVGKPVKASVVPASDNATGQQKKVEMQRYAVNYAIAGQQLALTPNGDTRRAILDFIVTAFDDDGSVVFHIAFKTTSDLKPAGYRDMLIGGLRMHRDVDIPANAASLRLGVFDEQSRHLGTLELPLPLKAPPDDPIARARRLPPIEPD